MCIGRQNIRRWFLPLAFVTPLLLLGLLVWLLNSEGHNSGSELVSPPGVANLPDTRPVVKNSHPVESNPPESINPKPQIPTNLMNACPEPRADSLSEECWSYMDNYFPNQKGGHQRMHWIDFSEEMTLGRVFQDPVRARQKVIEALNNPSMELKTV